MDAYKNDDGIINEYLGAVNQNCNALPINDTHYQCVTRVIDVDNGLFHLISIHPLWMTFNECPGGYF